MQGLWKTSCAVAALAILVVCSTPASASPIHAYLDELTIGGPSIDIGEDVTAKAFPDPYLGPIASLPGPITAGAVTGQFDITCDTPGGPPACTTAAYFDGANDMLWGALDVTGGWAGAYFVSNGAGETLFPSSYGINGWLGSPGFALGAGLDQRNALISFDISHSNTGSGGISLLPGRSYILFAINSVDTGLAGATQVPTVDGLQTEINATYVAATGDVNVDGIVGNSPLETQPAFQFAQEIPSGGLFDDGTTYFATQLITSRVIPIVPEPATLSLLAGAMLLAARRRSRA